LGKYFAVDGGNLYIFTTGRDALINLNSFPPGLGIFGADTAWRVSPRVAVVEDVLLRQLERAQIVLGLHSYEKVSLNWQDLEEYFVNGYEYKVVEKTGDKRTLMPAITVDEGEC
jgi:hypothetical protein